MKHTQWLFCALTFVGAGSAVAQARPLDGGVYATATESNIIAHLVVGDSIDIQLAQLALTKASDQRVKDYAAILASEHTTHLARVLRVMEDAHLASLPLANDQEVARAIASLNALSTMPGGPEWDALFLRSQVRHHQNELDIATVLSSLARTDALRDVMSATVRSLIKHRDVGKSVATTLGVLTK